MRNQLFVFDIKSQSGSPRPQFKPRALVPETFNNYLSRFRPANDRSQLRARINIQEHFIVDLFCANIHFLHYLQQELTQGYMKEGGTVSNLSI